MTFNSECIVLKSSNYKESDKIYTLYTKNRGKITAVGKGVRKLSSRRGGLLDTSNHVDLKISLSEVGFNYISEVSHKNSFMFLKDDLDISSKVFYVLELVYRLTEEEDTQPEIFDLLLSALKLINSKSLPTSSVIVYFELMFLKHLGYALRFDKCISCGLVYSDSWADYRINLVLGGFVCGSCQTGLKIPFQDAKALNALSYGRISKDTDLSSETLYLLRSFMQSILEDKFRSVRVFGG